MRPRQASRGRHWLVRLDRTSSTPLHEQIRSQIRRTIETARLPPSTPLPSSRSLAADLEVSRATVVLAYEQLRAEGWLETRAGGTTHVAAGIEWRPARRAATGHAPSARRISARGQAIVAAFERNRLEVPVTQAPRAFATSQPAVDLIPTELWGRLLSKRWRQSPPKALGYGDPRGLPELRTATAAYLARVRGVVCSPEQVIITQGAQQALDLLARVLVDPNDRAWMEEPGYPAARVVLAAAGARLVPVPVDDEGLRVDEGIRRAPGARLVFVTPARQMPLGGSMSDGRRAELLAWAAGDDRRWIIEDDYDSEFRYTARQTAALQSLDRAGSVVHIGTFTKVLFPALRLGYMVVPPSLVDVLTAAKRATDFSSPYLEQAVMADVLREGHFDRHIRRLRTAYRTRHAALTRAVDAELGGLATLAPSDAGRAAVLWLAPGMAERDALTALHAAGISATPYSVFCAEPGHREGLILGYGGLRERAIREGVQRLAVVLRRLPRA